jgi:hypothetical protein
MNAPAKIPAIEAIIEMLDLIETLERLDRAPDAILKTIETLGGGVWFAGGGYTARYRGVVGTSTVGGAALVKSWMRAARRRIEGAQA